MMKNKQKQTCKQKVVLPIAAERLWTILTDSKYTKQYMYNCTVTSDWKVGSPIIWEGNYQGYQAYQKGVILANKPLQLLKFTTFDPNFGMEDKPENYIHVSYLLEAVEDGIQLTVINETFDGNAERMTHIEQGWASVLASIEKLAQAWFSGTLELQNLPYASI